MTRAAHDGIGVVLLDIEGTTTPISFVYETLFPYARRHLRSFLSAHRTDPEVAKALGMLGAERGGDGIDESQSLASYAESLMDKDSKSTGLKAIQGLIWKTGYETGAIRGEVFPDVPEAFCRWTATGVRIAIYSSGSELAQRLLFRHTGFGDLTPSIVEFFDTRVGPKRDAGSYRAIANRLGCAAGQILFVSDVAQEIVAASQAGCRAVLIVRPGNPPQTDVANTATVGDLLALA